MANSMSFSLKKNGAKEYECTLPFDGYVGLTHDRPKQEYHLWIQCRNDEEKEQAQNVLKKLVNDLINNKGYINCLIKNSETNEYISSYKTESTDGWTNIVFVCIYFKEQPITEINMSYGT